MSLGIQSITTIEHTYVLFVELKDDSVDLESELKKVLGEFFEEKADYIWFTAREIVLNSAVVFHDKRAILVISSLYPSKINEIAEKLSDFTEVEVHLAKDDLTVQKPKRT